ncbi:MAG: glycine betaine ABC transporter substrate-binding protein [Ilumatobacteraceae bacterium]
MSRPVRRSRALRALTACIALATIAAACGSDDGAGTTTIALPQTVIVTHVDGDPTSQLMGALYAQALENAGLRVIRKDPIGDRTVYYQALQQGTVEIVPELTGDLLTYLHSIGATPHPATTTTAPTTTTIPGETVPSVPVEDSTTAATTTTDAGPTTTTTLPTNPRTVTDQATVLRALLPFELSISEPSTAEVKQVIACSQTATEAHTLGTITDLGAVADQITLGGPAGFETSTPLGLGTLADSYHANFKQFVPLTDDQIADAVKNGTVDCVATSSVNPVIAAQTMTVLLDDKALVDPNAVMALVNGTAGTATVLQALNGVDSKLTQTDLTTMLGEMANNKQSPDYLASVYLSTTS